MIANALRAEDLPFDAGQELIRLCFSRQLLGPANELVDKLAARGCSTPEFFRQAAQCKLWTNREDIALDYFKRAYDAAGDDADFHDAVRLAHMLDSKPDMVALFTRRGEAALTNDELALYAASLMGLGEYETALHVSQRIRVTLGADVATLRDIARLQRVLLRPDAALETYRELVRLEPDNAEWRDNEFHLLITLRREPEAIVAAERNWHETHGTRHLAAALRTAICVGDDVSVLRLALQAVDAAGTAEPEVLLEACYHLQIEHRVEPRIAILETLAARFPERLDIAMELLVHDYNRRAYAGVERRFVRHPALGESREGCGIRIAARLSAGEHDAARDLLDRSLESHLDWSDHGDFAEVVTNAAIVLRDVPAAATLTDRFLSRKPAAASRAVIHAGRLLVAQGKPADAVRLYAGVSGGMSSEMRMDYAGALAAAGGFSEAEAQMERAIAENHIPDPRLYSRLGDLRLSAGAPEKARDAYRHALALMDRR